MSVSLLLASASPRRKELLTQLGISFELVDNDFDETPLASESPEVYVQRLAIGKALSARRFVSKNMRSTKQVLPIMGADTIVVLDGDLLGKPKDKADAMRTLKRLSGKTHYVYTGVALVGSYELTKNSDHESGHELEYGSHEQVIYSKTQVDFAPLSDELIEQYCASDEPYGKAGSYAIQGSAGSFVEQFIGSYTGIVGLPLYETRLLLEKAGIVISLATKD